MPNPCHFAKLDIMPNNYSNYECEIVNFKKWYFTLRRQTTVFGLSDSQAEMPKTLTLTNLRTHRPEINRKHFCNRNRQCFKNNKKSYPETCLIPHQQPQMLTRTCGFQALPEPLFPIFESLLQITRGNIPTLGSISSCSNHNQLKIGTKRGVIPQRIFRKLKMYLTS